ncbi:MAG: SDR family oxidoreductase [Gammaproteobacteria bacterium]|nr:SDR family oxidoreductase [Gammaproteobacteria bacterium]
MDKPILIITGGSRGIGLATIERFLEQGSQVINLSRRPCEIMGVTNLNVDLAKLAVNQDEIQHELAAELGEPMVISLVHNAGHFVHDTVYTQSLADARAVLEVNLIAPIILNQLLIPFMAPGSSIIYIGSTLAEKAVPNCASYIVSKHAIAGLMKATCQDLAGKGIHTCCVCPGITETEMLQARCEQQPGLLDTLSQLSTYGRLIQPHEMAELIEFCSLHPIINGAMIHGNLGQIER